MPGRRLHLKAMTGTFAVCRLEPGTPIPEWASGGAFLSITRTAEEVSIVCEETIVPPGVRHEPGWLCFQVRGPFAFDGIGILASLIDPLAAAGVSVFSISTFDTDYLMVKRDMAAAARAAWIAAGHDIC